MRRFGSGARAGGRHGGGCNGERESGGRQGPKRRRTLIEMLEQRVLLANQPDLLITAAAAPATAVEGNAAQISITWNVKNQGTAATSGSWSDAVYLSSSGALDSGSLRIDTLDESFQGPLAPGASYSVTRVLTIPGAATGAQFLVVQTDDGQTLDESNTTNNLYSLPITLSSPDVDLEVTGATAPASALAGNGNMIAVSWTVKNRGAAAAKGDSTDAVYLSDTPTFDPQTAHLLDSRSANDQLPLAAGASYTVSRSIALGDLAPGSRYLFFSANSTGSQGESDQGAATNNLFSLPITINSAGNIDLAVTGATAPAAAVAGNGQAINVSYTVENQGTTAAASKWSDAIYLSSQPTYDSSAIPLSYYSGASQAPLAAGASYAVTQSLVLPPHAAGAAYLLFRADRYDDQSETTKANNVFAVPITLSAPNVDLTVTSAAAPATAEVGNQWQIAVDYTAKNQGSSTASGSWTDAIYVSGQPTFDSSARLLETLYSGSDVPSSLAAGASYSVHDVVTIPNTAAGARYLLVRTNVGAGSSSSQAETDATNNVFALPMTLAAPAADLAVSNVTAPAAVEAGNGQSITVSWKVTNQGSAAADSYWYDNVLVGDDGNYDRNATGLFGYYSNYQSQLPAGASYVVTKSVAAPNVTPGAKQLVFVTDTGDNQAEIQKSNNLVALPITFTQADVDLTVTAATAPAAAVAGAAISVTWSVKNQGGETAAGDWSDAVYLSDVPTFDGNAVMIDSFSSPASLAAGGTYSPVQTVTLPGSASGNKYLLFVTNRGRTQGETNYANDVYAVPFVLSSPDLKSTALTAPSTAILGDKISVSWTVTNQGSVTAPGGWSDAIYLSDTPGGNPFGVGDTYVGSFSHSGSLAPGASYTQQQTMTLPASAVGNRYLVVVANAFGDVGDADLANNRFAVPITLSAPDLTVTAATAPASGVENDSIQVSWTVKNQGAVKAPANWTDDVYVSNRPTYDGTATYLGSFNESAHSGLAAGASYTESQSVALPASAVGAQYLLFVTNQYGYQPESDTPGGYSSIAANNVFAVPITLSAPDLAVTAAAAPAAAVVGNGVSIPISYTVKNQGSVSADGSWNDNLYLSDRPVYDSTATYVSSLGYHSDPLAAGASYSGAANVTVPNTAVGARYLLVVTNPYRGQGESDAAGSVGANNVYALPITFTSPNVDLTVTGATAPASVITGDTFPVSFTVKNQGTDAAGASWTDQVYFSKSAVLDSSAVSVGGFSEAQRPLPAGASYVQNQSITLSNVPAGTGYLLFVTNSSNNQSETDGTNNAFAVPITVGAPDLAVTAASGPAAAVVGDNQQLAVSYTVQNVGSVPAHGSWYDALYVSDKPTFDNTATFVAQLEQSPPALGPGASYSDNFNVSLPTVGAGARYLLFVANAGQSSYYSSQPEADGQNGPGANNVFAVPITLTAPSVDLSVSNPSAPAAVVSGGQVSVSFEVTNQGNDAAAASWTDGVYFSTSATFDKNQATLLGSFPAAQSPLAGGAHYDVNRTISLPDLPLGAGYLFFATNIDGRQSETDDGTDNVVSLPVVIGAPDLAVTAASAPNSANTGDSISVSWSVANQGASPAPTGWTDVIYLSNKPTFNSSARYLAAFDESAHAELAAGDSYNDSQNVTVPTSGLVGSLYLLVVTNAYAAQPESDGNAYYSPGANNVYALPITIGAPDLAITAATAPASAVVGNNSSIAVSYTVSSQGAVAAGGSWSDYLYVSDKPNYDSSAEYATTLRYNYSGLAAGSSYTQNSNVTLPLTATGARYLLFVTNAYGGISETDGAGGVDANDVYAVPITLSAPNVDLAPLTPTAPATATVGQNIAVSFTVTNNGGEAAAAGWSDVVYYSTKPTYDSSAVSVGYFYPSQVPLGAGASYTDSGNVTLSSSLPIGAGYLLFVVDAYKDQGESDKTNNVVSLPITLSAADLGVTAVTAPSSAAFDSSISVSWTVTNQGSVAAPGNWTDAVYISSQPYWQYGATQIATFNESSQAGLAPGANYTDTRNITIPSYLRSGDVYLIVRSDVYSSTGDTNRQNNYFAAPIHLSPSAADLTVSSATAPAAGVLGGSIAVSWTVTNQGTKDASSNWTDAVYLSTKPTYDNTAVFLDYLNAPPAASSPLTPGASYTLNDNLYLSGSTTGAMYLLFVTNSNHNQSESNATNDVYALPITISAPDLTVSAASAPAAAALGQTISVSWTTANSGSAAAPATWYDAVYVSSKNTFDNTATLVESFYEGAHAGLAGGGFYSETQNITLPATGLGQRYLLFVTDAFHDQPETSEANNVYAVPITLAAPDLTVSGATAPAAADLGAPISVSWTVQNSSAVAVPAAWHDAVYVSSIPTLDGTATLVAQFDESAQAGLAAGASYTDSQSITLPSTAIGQRYLLFVTDKDQGQPETNAANDVYALPITLSGADLTVAGATAPSIAAIGSTIDLSWTVKNQGNAVAQANWSDGIYLSNTNVLDGSAVYVGSFPASAAPLASGASYALHQSVTIPNTALGSRFLLIATDSGQQQAESSEFNNTLALPIQLAQVDLAASSVSAPADANFGDKINVSWTATNAGSTSINQAWSDRIYLSSSSTLDLNTARLLATVDESAQAPLGPGASYSQSAQVTLPLDAATTPGSYYVFIVVDGLNQASETNETNNAASEAITIGLPALPDLVPTHLVVPASGLTGQGFNVSWTDQNQGAATATGPWQDYVWISTSNTLDSNARYFGRFTYSDSLDPGQAVTRTQHFNLPGAAGQYYIIVRADADGAINEGPNAAHSTSTSATAIDVQSTPLPDLVVSAIIRPNDGVLSGTTVPVNFTVTNNGNAPTQAPAWTDAVFVSQLANIQLTGDDLTDAQKILDQPLGVPYFPENASYLAPGQSYQQTVNVALPVAASGTWYVYVVANRSFLHTPLDNFIDPGPVRESSKLDNLTRSAGFNITQTPLADLATVAVQAPTQAFSGQTMNLTWTVTNQGPGTAVGQALHVGFAPTQPVVPTPPAGSTWQESVYLSSEQSLNSSAILLKTFTRAGVLAPGASYTESQSVPLPIGVSGNYYFIVTVDPAGQVFESGATANNTLSTAATTNVNLTPPPDLEVSAISAPSTALASHQLTVNYTIKNAGSTATPLDPITNAVTWTDRVYLGSGPTLDPATDLELGEIEHDGVLNAGASYNQVANFTLPDGLSGTFHLFVVTDSGNLVFELDKSNNVVSASNATVVSSKPADLIVTAASAPAAANPGQVIPVSWTVTNQGLGDTAVTAWTDKVYATIDAALGANRILVGAFTRQHGLVQPGASYTETELVTIPYTLSGAYNLFVVADAQVTQAEDGQGAATTGPGGKVYEGANEDNNVSTALAVSISARLADLTVGQVQLVSPATLATGGPATVSWTVQNSGTAATGSTHWYDDFYLSPTPTFDPQSAVYLGSAFHNNPLGAGAQYSTTATFTVPPDLAAGTEYLIVRADRPSRPANTDPKYVNLVVESSEFDNDGASAAITVILGPTPDLTTSVSAPLAALSGQTIHVDWSVTNHGASTLADNAHWYDAVYLSLDTTFDSNSDVPLGSVAHSTGLAAGDTYASSGDFRLPAGLAGMYYVIVVADAAASVFERGVSADRIGLSGQTLDISLQPPLDLVAGTVTVPASAVPGQPITVTYAVTNNSANAYAGDWFDSLYLSPTNAWQLANPLLGRVHHTSGVAANGSYSETLTAPLPGVSPGTYYVILRSDIRNQVPETDETNNLSASAQTSLDVPAIVAGTPGAPVAGSLAQGGSAYYKVTVDAGQTLQFTLDDAQTNDVNGLFVSFGQMPSPSQADFHGDQALGANQSLTIPSTQAGTYYLQVINRTVYGYSPQANPTALANYSLTASIIPFSVTSVSPGQVGNAGSSTLQIAGARFDRDTTFELIDGQGSAMAARFTRVESATTAFATFDLTGKPAGSYALRATQLGGATALLANALTLTVGTGPSLEAQLSGNSRVRLNREAVVQAEYGNRGDSDLPAPLLIVHSPTNTPLSLNPLEELPDQNLMFLGVASSGPAGVLRPGANYSMPIYFETGDTSTPFGFELTTITADDTDPVDWDVVQQFVAPSVKLLPNWNAVYAQLQSQIGASWGSFDREFAADATLMPPGHGDNFDLYDLMGIEIAKAAAAVETSISGVLHAADAAVTASGRFVEAVNTTTGETFGATAYTDGSFLLPQVTPGEYRFTVDGLLVGGANLLAIAAGQALQQATIGVSRGAQLSGQVVEQETGRLIAGAQVRAVAADGTAYSTTTDSTGHYLLTGLEGSTYEIVVDSAGRARTTIDGVSASVTDRLAENFSLPIESTLVADITAPNGFAPPNLVEMIVTVAGFTDPELNFVATAPGLGTLEIAGLPAGSYSVKILADGYVTQTISAVSVGPQTAVNLGPIELVPAADISGTVTSTDPQNPAAGLVVGVYSGATLKATATTDAAGAFHVGDLAPGSYTVRPTGITVIADADAITLAAGESLTGVALQVSPGGTISGVVTNAQSGAAAPKVLVFMADSAGHRNEVATDSAGSYRFDHLPPGSYQLYLEVNGAGASQTVNIATTSDQKTVNLQATFATQISGHLLDSLGTPIANGTVDLWQGGQQIGTSHTDGNGSYAFYVVSGGTYSLQGAAAADSFVPVTNLVVGATQPVQQDLTAGSATLTVQVTDSLQSVIGATVYLTQQSSLSPQVLGSAIVDASGAATFANLAAGDYTVVVKAAGNRGAQTTASLTDGGAGQATLALEQQGELQGVVTDATSAPLAGAVVALYSQTDANLHPVTVSLTDGTFDFSNVPPGTYDLVIFTEGYAAFTQNGISINPGIQSVSATLSASTSSLSGQIVDSNGQPVNNGDVTVTDAAGHIVWRGSSHVDGTFTVTTAVGTGLSLHITASGYAGSDQTGLSATPGSNIDVGTVHLTPVALPDAGFQIPLLPPVSTPAILAAALAKDLEHRDDEVKSLSPLPGTCVDACEEEFQAAIHAENLQFSKFAEAKNREELYHSTARDAALTFLDETAEQVVKLGVAGIAIAALAGVEVPAGGAVAIAYAVASVADFANSLVHTIGAFEAREFSASLQGTASVSFQTGDLWDTVANALKEEIAEEWKLPIKLGPITSLLSIVSNYESLWKTLTFAETKERAEEFEKAETDYETAKDEYNEAVDQAKEARDEYEHCKAEHNDDSDKCGCKKDPASCGSPDPNPTGHHAITWPSPFPGIPGGSFDPNDIIGPPGYGDQHFVPANQPLAYEIDFENEPTATAPAQEVTITEQLDPKIDPRSFRLGDFGWGGMRFSPPADSAFYQTTIDETDSLGILVQVTATIDVSTGTAVWDFLSIDPATGEKPLDGSKGFLPPDDGSGGGQGFVSYTVLPKAGVQTGDVIHAQATVFFDANAPIDTRTIFNSIDAGDALGSQMAALPANEPTSQFTLSWTPAEQGSNGSAVASYSIYVSDNGGAFLPFLLNTTASEALFTGEKGHTYAFYSLATDNAGNLQSPASAVQVSTTVGDAVQSSSGKNISPVEGQSFSGAVATFTGTDPNGQGTDFTAMIDWGDGSSLTAGTITGSAAAGYTVSGSHIYLEEGANLPLKVIVADQTDQQTTVIGLANVADAPITAAAVSFTATEGITFSGTVATLTDADPHGTLGDYSATIDWGDGSSATAGTIAVNPGGGFLVTGSHVYAGEGGYPVIVTIADAGGANDTAASTANVADAALDATAVSISATEGATFSGTAATFVDANLNSDVGDFTALIDWGDGSPTTAGTIAANPGGGFVVNGSHVYAEEGASSITVTISDVGGSKATAHSTAQIADAPLTAVGISISTTEGATFSGAVATFTDADPNGEVGDYTAVIHWGDGSSSAGTIAAGANGFTVSGSHAYAEEGAALPLSVVISDAGGAQATATGAVDVADARLHMTAAAVSIPTGGAAEHVLLATFTDTGGAEPVGDYAAVIDWGDGSPSEAGEIEFSSGVFQIFGSHAYTSGGAFTIGVTVKDEGGATDGLTEQASIELTAHQKYVIAVYQDVLARAPDPGGLAYWSQLLDGGAVVSSVAHAIAHSDEYYANFVIKPDYVKLLGREADDSGVTYWTGRMHDGLTDQQLEAMLVSSDEFYANSGGTNLAWIDAIYKLLLGRAADSSGESYWTGQLAAGQSRQQVAEGIADSAENDAQLINEDYFHYLGRDADPDGLAYWLAQFAAGQTNEDVIAGFTGSDEYYQQHTK